jgi:hypothetical protein
MIVVFVMDGCEACDDYSPRLHKMIESFQAHQHPFVYYELGMQISPGVIPVIMLDATSEDPSVVNLADQYQIDGLPSTLLLRRTALPVKLEGAVDDQEIYSVLADACVANR